MTLFGVNVPYLRGDYGHDLAPNPRFPDWPVRFDPLRAYRPLIEAKAMGFGAFRMWLCENAEGLVIDAKGHVTGVHPKLLESIAILQEAAALHGLRIYWCLLDGNAVSREGDPITRSILDDAAQAERFAERVVGPIAAALDPRLTYGLELVSEPETATEECMTDASDRADGAQPVPWAHIGRMLRTGVAAALSERLLLVSAGTMHVFLPHLWKTDPGLTAIDVHIYFAEGGIPPRKDLAAYVGDAFDATLPLIGGELGIPKDESAAGGEFSLLDYLSNARDAGYDAAFLWQLEGDLIDKNAPRRSRTAAGEEAHRRLRG